MRTRFVFSFVLSCLLLLSASCTFSVDYTQGSFNCTQDADCPTDYKCQDQICVPKTCRTDTDCPKNFRCNNNSCVSNTTPPPTPCSKQEDCSEFQETCAPDLDGKGRFCVVRCDVVKQEGCPSGDICVLLEGRGYCRAPSGNKPAGGLCEQELDCELNLYCRPVAGFERIKRCTPTCDIRKLGQECPTSNQRCLPLTQKDQPIGYCEPVSTKVKQGEICGGDIACETGLACKPSPNENFNRCQ
ncbi:MAG: hypothetical protein H6727_00670 [Myxococcales bacterium]|nr:hypothetical protein [Myxococcales bacterium]